MRWASLFPLRSTSCTTTPGFRAIHSAERPSAGCDGLSRRRLGADRLQRRRYPRSDAGCSLRLGVLAVFALAVASVAKPLRGLPAFTAAFLLLASPLFYAQSMMAQLDMPAMVFTAIALVALLAAASTRCAALACTVLVLMKETSIAVPAVFGAWHASGNADGVTRCTSWLRPSRSRLWLGIPVPRHRAPSRKPRIHALQRRFPIASRATWCHVDPPRVLHFHRELAHHRNDRHRTARGSERRSSGRASGASSPRSRFVQTLIVTVLGGAALERYLMPVLPLFYIAVAAALSTLERRPRRIATAASVRRTGRGNLYQPDLPFPV